jgi:(R,R)-butanediol dehydrogenase / meso-butanediol dehydrogenase / diacetyl reductase
MRAAVFHGVGEKLAVEDRQRPVAEAGGLVLKVAYAGICGSDIHATEKSLVPLEPGTVLGHEFAGEVVESASPDWMVGDRVIGVPLRECDACRPLGQCKDGLGILCGKGKIIGMSAGLPGAYAEYVRLGAGHALRVPDGISLKAAALTEPLAVGAHAVRLAGSLYGRHVLVVGAGPIGLAVITFARFAGARSVAVSELDPTRRQRAAAFGATSVLDPRSESIGPALVRTGAVPDLIFECVGAPGLIRECMDLLPIQGRLVVVGVNRGEDTILPRVAIRKELSIKFALGYQREDFALVLDLMASGRIDAEALVSSVIGFADLPEVFERLRRPNPDAKVLIDPSR